MDVCVSLPGGEPEAQHDSGQPCRAGTSTRLPARTAGPELCRACTPGAYLHSPVARGEPSSLLSIYVTHQQLPSITCLCVPARRAFPRRGKVWQIQSLPSSPAFPAHSLSCGAVPGPWQHCPFLPCSTLLLLALRDEAQSCTPLPAAGSGCAAHRPCWDVCCLPRWCFPDG